MKRDPALVFRAFSDPTRLRILRMLSKGELCVCDITAVLRAPQPKVSRHLAYLKRTGLVSDRRDGLWRYYSIAGSAESMERRVLGCVDDDAVMKRDLDAVEKVRKARGCC